MIVKNWLKLIPIAAVGAAIGWSTGFPIGALIGTLIIVAIAQTKYSFIPHVPVSVRRVIQVLIGSSLGLSFGPDTVNAIKDVLLIAILMPLLHILLALSLSLLLIKMLKIDPITVLCSMAPAGVAEMIIISEKYNAQIPTVVTVHVYRVIVIITLIPPIILFGI